MNTPSPNAWEQRWKQLTHRARAAGTPPVDVAAAVRAALAAPPPADAWQEFAALFGRTGVFGVCAAGVVLCAGFAWWQGTSAWQEIEPLTQWLLAAGPWGGAA